MLASMKLSPPLLGVHRSRSSWLIAERKQEYSCTSIRKKQKKKRKEKEHICTRADLKKNCRRVAQTLGLYYTKSFRRGAYIHKRHHEAVFRSYLHQLYAQYRFYSREHSHFMLYKVKEELLKSGLSRSFHAFTASSKISHHAEITWKMVSQLCACRIPALSPVGKIACAVSLALTRSNLVAPGIIAVIIGEVAWSRRSCADAEAFCSKDTLYMQAIDGHILVTAFLYSVVEGVILLLRAIYLAALFFPCMALAPLANSLGIEFRRTWLHMVHRTLEKAGPAFIKWGQWAAARPDIFPRDLCSELSKLHSKAPSHSFSFTKKSIEAAFGRKLNEIFGKFEEKPVASGSIAQVHRATLKYRYPGREMKPIVVAVKVRHPGVGEAIRRDFLIIKFVAKILKFIPGVSWLRLDESIQQFAVYMMSQVDLSREAVQLSRFIYNFRSWKDVSFPKPLYPLVHPAVLVETYEQGESVMYYVDELEGHARIKSDLARIGTHALLKMLLVDNFVHADMHPGNILVRLEHDRLSHKQLFSSKPHVILLDVGLTAELSKIDRVNILEFFKAVVLRDGRAAAECTLKLSKRQNCPDPKAFIKDVEKSFYRWDCNPVPPGECIRELLEHVRRHKVNIDGNVCTVMVTTLVLEGWQRKLDPAYNVMHALHTLLFKADMAESLIHTMEGLMAA